MAGAAHRQARLKEVALSVVVPDRTLGADLRRRLEAAAAPVAGPLDDPGPRQSPLLGVLGRAVANQPAGMPDRLSRRHVDRGAAWNRSGHDDRADASPDVLSGAGLGLDHAGGHLLRRPVRRLDDGNPRQHAGRDLLRGDGARRLRHGAAGPRRAGADDRRARLPVRGHRLHPGHLPRRPAAGRRSASRSARRSTAP